MSSFKGSNFDPLFDAKRLTKQLGRIWQIVIDGKWRTLAEIREATKRYPGVPPDGYPEASISAQLRNLKKQEFGSYRPEKRPRGDRRSGLYEYRLLPPIGRQAAFAFEEDIKREIQETIGVPLAMLQQAEAGRP